MIIGMKMWPVKRTQSKKLTTHDARRTTDAARSQQLTQSTSCSGELNIYSSKT